MLALLGKFGERKRFGKIDVGKLEQSARVVAAAHIAHDVGDHAGRKDGAHDGQIFPDGVENADGTALGRVGR